VDKKWLISCIFQKKGLISVQEERASLEELEANLHFPFFAPVRTPA